MAGVMKARQISNTWPHLKMAHVWSLSINQMFVLCHPMIMSDLYSRLHSLFINPAILHFNLSFVRVLKRTTHLIRHKLNFYNFGMEYLIWLHLMSAMIGALNAGECFDEKIYPFFAEWFEMLIVNSSPPCSIFLTISPLSRHTDESHLEINWGPGCESPPDSISLYNQDPSISDDSPLLTVRTGNESSGNIRTAIKLGKLILPGGWNQDEAMEKPPRRVQSKCLPFYVTSFKADKRELSDCLKIQPNWMSSEPMIGRIPLKALFLPGTHCSGCYHGRTYTKSVLLKRFGYVQNFDVWTQLVFGIRYLDFSIGFVCLSSQFQIYDENFIEILLNFADITRTRIRPLIRKIIGSWMTAFSFHHFCRFWKKFVILCWCPVKRWSSISETFP